MNNQKYIIDRNGKVRIKEISELQNELLLCLIKIPWEFNYLSGTKNFGIWEIYYSEL